MVRRRFAGRLLLVIVALFIPTAHGEDYPPVLVAPTEALEPRQQLAKFHLPPGFEIQLVACEPDIYKPMNLNFDARGRLYVSSSLEYPFPPPAGQEPRDKLVRLTDRNGDGQADEIEQLLDGLTIPIGVTPTPGGLIYYSIPNIYKLPDQDAGSAQGELLYGEFGFRDTHGMANSFTRWIDGWIYACHGFANDSQVRGLDGNTVVMNSGNTFRMRADGSRVEPWTRGQVNPFGLCFDPLGNLFSADCHTMPIYQLLRGAWYPSFGKPHDGLGFGPTMIGHDHGSTGIAGVVYYGAEHFPAQYRDTVFIGNPVTGRVNHDRLELHGSTFQAIEQPDFITCDDPWFRPVDLKLGPDGALYIADFYNCIIGHYEVPLTHPRRDRHRGRIWRVVYTGADDHAPAAPMPDLDQLDAARLVSLLGDANITRRVLATEQLVARGDVEAVRQVLAEPAPGEEAARRRAHALWVVERVSAQGLDDATLARLADDPSRLVRGHLVKALAERADWSQSDLDLPAIVREKLSDPDAFVRRSASEALGRHPQLENIEPLFELWQSAPAQDTHLVHVVRMALRDHLLAPGMYAQLDDLAGRRTEWAPRLAELSLGAPTAESAELLLSHLSRKLLPPEQLPSYFHHVARYLTEGRLPEAWRLAESYRNLPPAEQQQLLLALHRAAQQRGGRIPDDIANWAAQAAEQLLAGNELPSVQAGIDLARELRLEPLHAQLAAIAGPEGRFPDLRPAAIDACVATDAHQAVPLLSNILGNPAEPMSLRQKAAAALANINRPDALAELVDCLRTAPGRLAVEIAGGLALRAEGGELLLAAVESGAASPRLLQERVVAERLRAAAIADLDVRLERLTAGLPPADERIRELIQSRREAFAQAQCDPALGQQVFTKHCAACHRLNGQGTKIGPELDGIGLRGSDRLLEDILDPSRNVDQAFRTTVVSTLDGNVVTGLLLREEGDVLVLADSEGKEVRLPASNVDERQISPLSPMPANVADLAGEQELLHLLAFLLEQKQQPPQPQGGTGK